ncbi:uncharacterized protein LOC141897139 isoform X1 [Acropora palmata]|uniref:uncharacterized protein LOC141897139 isoform X1 n=1 Tax=Acropora palmata TaxID=6131 RepID=UPI003DA074A3
MASQDEDCYFYYYSTCAKGDDCPYRHQPAALGNEITCELWEKGICSRKVCKFRHSVIMKNRSDTPCFFESQPQGCLKPHCPFFHKEPRPAMSGNVAGPSMSINEPPLVQPVNPQPTATVSPNVALPVPQTASPMMASQAGMKIPIISTPARPRPAMHPRGGMVRPPATMQYPPASAQPIPIQQPPPMVRNPQFIGPPRPVASMVQPISVCRGFSPLLQGPPGRYKPREIPMLQHSYHHPFMYAGQPEGSKAPFVPTITPYEEKRIDRDYEKQDSDLSSGSENGEDQSRSHHANRRKVVGGSHREVFASKKRELHKSKRPKSSKPVRDKDRSPSKRRPIGGRVKSRSSAETDRDRMKPRRKSSRKSPEIDDQGKEDDKLQTKESASKDESKKEETDPEEKSDDFEDLESPDIKVKTLEEILREKALKKLEERRAQNKEAKTEEKSNMEDVYENDEKVEERIVDQSENSEQPPVKKAISTTNKEKAAAEKSSKKMISFRKVSSSDTFSTDDNVNASSEKTVRRKVSGNNDKNWPLKKVISTVSREGKGVKPLIKGTEDGEKAPKKDNDKGEEGKAKEPPSPFQQVRVKSFEEIMELKRRRRAEKDSLKECSENADDDSTTNSTAEPANSSAAITLSPPKRLKSMAKKMNSDEEKNETKAVPSSGADSAGNGVLATRKRSVFVMEKPASPNKKTTNIGVKSAANLKGDKTNAVNSLRKVTVADRPGAAKVKVKSFDEIMAEKRQRTLQNKGEEKQDTKAVTQLRNKKREATKPSTVIKPRRIKVWAHGAGKSKSKDDYVISSTAEVTQRAQSDAPDATALTSSSVEPCRADIEDDASAVFMSTTEQVSTTDQNGTFETSDNIPGVDPRQGSEDKMTVDNTEEEARDGVESSDYALNAGQQAEQQVIDPPGSKELPSYDERKQAIPNEISKEDDLFDSFEADIDLEEDDSDLDGHSDVNEDDLLMELDEMINQ